MEDEKPNYVCYLLINTWIQIDFIFIPLLVLYLKPKTVITFTESTRFNYSDPNGDS